MECSGGPQCETTTKKAKEQTRWGLFCARSCNQQPPDATSDGFVKPPPRWAAGLFHMIGAFDRRPSSGSLFGESTRLHVINVMAFASVICAGRRQRRRRQPPALGSGDAEAGGALETSSMMTPTAATSGRPEGPQLAGRRSQARWLAHHHHLGNFYFWFQFQSSLIFFRPRSLGVLWRASLSLHFEPPTWPARWLISRFARSFRRSPSIAPKNHRRRRQLGSLPVIVGCGSAGSLPPEASDMSCTHIELAATKTRAAKRRVFY